MVRSNYKPADKSLGDWTRPESVCLPLGTDVFERADEMVRHEMAIASGGVIIGHERRKTVKPARTPSTGRHNQGGAIV